MVFPRKIIYGYIVFLGNENSNGFKYPEEYTPIILKNKIVEDIEPWALICEFEKLLNFSY